MIGTLFVKECRQILKSLVYYIYLVIFVVFITSQMSGTEWIDELDEPQPGQQNYGYGLSDSESVLMETGLEKLFEEVRGRSFLTYPFGFAKDVVPDNSELEEITEILEYCTGTDMMGLEEAYTAYWMGVEGEMVDYETYMRHLEGWHIPVREGLSYDEFLAGMEQVSQIVGKGSMYDGRYAHYAKEPLSYEDAMQSYRELCEKDGVTGAQMRLFCDYAGIIVAFLPIFVGVASCLRDRRAKADEVIYSKAVSGFTLMASRYAANVVMVFVPVVIWAFLAQMPCVYEAASRGIAADGFAFLKYSVIWLLPVIMVILSASFLITEATDTILAIPILFAGGIASLFSASILTGDFGWKLIARWNEFGGYGRFAQEAGQLYLNRGLYVILAAAGIFLTVPVYGKKREGGSGPNGKIQKNRG